MKKVQFPIATLASGEGTVLVAANLRIQIRQIAQHRRPRCQRNAFLPGLLQLATVPSLAQQPAHRRVSVQDRAGSAIDRGGIYLCCSTAPEADRVISQEVSSRLS
jgi:hypothetical protein